MMNAALATFILVIAAASEQTAHIGVPQKLEQVVLPGTELEVKPISDRKQPLILRIVNVDRHGTAHRYDFTYYTMEAGNYDLRDYLQRKDGSPLGKLPEMKVVSKSALPAGQVLPHDPLAGRPPTTGGYWLAVAIAGVIWLIVFLAIIFYGRRKKLEPQRLGAHRETLADRLRPLVERGLAGQLDLSERANLERSLLAFWTTKLKLESLKPAERFGNLRNHPDAGPLLNQLESWLHRPGAGSDVDLKALLRPYQNLPADALEPPVEVLAS